MGMREHVHLLTAHTPELGIELALAHRPDLILLDINMPGMDGYQVLNVIQASAELRRIPVVAITANAMPRDIERGKAAGFTDYLTKPLDIGHFLQVVDALLDTATITTTTTTTTTPTTTTPTTTTMKPNNS
jgi:CheY-like chemotaxis protein